MADPDTKDADAPAAPPFPTPSLEDMQHWTWVMGRAQQLMMEHLSQQMGEAADAAPGPGEGRRRGWPGMTMFGDPAKIMQMQADMWTEGLSIWQRALGVAAASGPRSRRRPTRTGASPPREWRDNPLYDTIRQTYLLISDRLLGAVDAIEGVDEATRGKMRFTTRAFVDAMAPSNFALTNPQVIERAMETKGESLLKGLEHLLKDLEKGQLSHVDTGAFEVGRNIAATPGKVIRQTPLYQLIQYAPATDKVLAVPLIIFPPWINRFYILDLNPKKSFIKWAVDQGLTVFVVSWKSADESLADIGLDDYVLAQAEAIDAVREALGVEQRPRDRLLRRRDDAGGDARAAGGARRGGQGRERDLLHRPGRFLRSRRPQAVHRRRADGADPPALRRQGLSRRALHGGDLQPAARPRPDLELRHLQLSDGRGLSAVRPAVLERRHHQFAGQVAPRLSHPALPREQAGPAGRGDDRRHADRPADGQGRRPTSRPGARTISRRRRACGRSPTISPGR